MQICKCKINRNFGINYDSLSQIRCHVWFARTQNYSWKTILIVVIHGNFNVTFTFEKDFR